MRYCRCGGGRYGRFCLLDDRLVRVSDKSERVNDQLTVNLNGVRDRGQIFVFFYFYTHVIQKQNERIKKKNCFKTSCMNRLYFRCHNSILEEYPKIILR